MYFHRQAYRANPAPPPNQPFPPLCSYRQRRVDGVADTIPTCLASGRVELASRTSRRRRGKPSHEPVPVYRANTVVTHHVSFVRHCESADTCLDVRLWFAPFLDRQPNNTDPDNIHMESTAADDDKQRTSHLSRRLPKLSLMLRKQTILDRHRGKCGCSNRYCTAG